MLEEGADNQQISDYLVARYGDFILYRPRLQQSTYLLWIAPAILLLTGAMVAGLVISRQRRKVPLSRTLGDEEQQRLDELLAGSVEDKNTNKNTNEESA